ncbi:MAG: LysR family transcriptional regulator [Alphaproteobacteria bacterium]|nr:LysR family transcriptional regulator [Alphaproteobacteria bacterium]
MTRLTIRIDLDDSAFGPGKARLLERVAECGSIRQAAVSMEMSYRRAWLLIQAIQNAFGGPVVTTATGGAHGGGATLTELGRTLLTTYRRIEERAIQAAAPDIKIFATLARTRHAARKPLAPKGSPAASKKRVRRRARL